MNQQNVEQQDLTEPQQEGEHAEETQWSADALAGLAALKRAAIKARRRAIETTGYVVTWRDGKIVYDTEV